MSFDGVSGRKNPQSVQHQRGDDAKSRKAEKDKKKKKSVGKHGHRKVKRLKRTESQKRLTKQRRKLVKGFLRVHRAKKALSTHPSSDGDSSQIHSVNLQELFRDLRASVAEPPQVQEDTPEIPTDHEDLMNRLNEYQTLQRTALQNLGIDLSESGDEIEETLVILEEHLDDLYEIDQQWQQLRNHIDEAAEQMEGKGVNEELRDVYHETYNLLEPTERLTDRRLVEDQDESSATRKAKGFGPGGELSSKELEFLKNELSRILKDRRRRLRRKTDRKDLLTLDRIRIDELRAELLKDLILDDLIKLQNTLKQICKGGSNFRMVEIELREGEVVGIQGYLMSGEGSGTGTSGS